MSTIHGNQIRDATIPAGKLSFDVATQAELDVVSGAVTTVSSSVTTVSNALAAHIADASDAHDASAVSVVPFETIAATNVQDALQEVFDEASGGSPDAVLAQAGANGVTISGLQSDPDADVAGVNDNEFNAALSGWTTLGSLDTADANGTFKSQLHLVKNTSGFQLDGIYKACPSIPFTVTMKVTDRIQLTGRQVGLFLAEAVPGKLYTFGHAFDVIWDSGVWSDRTTRTSFSSGATNNGHPNKYLRIIVHSSTDIDIQISQTGWIWTTVASAVNPLGGTAVTKVGIFITSFAAVKAEGLVDFIRFT